MGAKVTICQVRIKMKFAGIQKTTLIDYPGKVACTLFTYGCDFRCPFCHNPELVTKKAEGLFPEEDALDFLNKRVGKLDGVAITGGEPLLHEGIPDFIKEVKDLGFLVKVDTNGNHPDKVEILLDLVDYWAMDIKNSPDKYSKTAGVEVDLDKIKQSVNLIMNKGKDYQFRTTFVPGLHDEVCAKNIGEMIKGAKLYVIQNFRGGKTIDSKYSSKKGFNLNQLQELRDIIEKYVTEVKIVEN
jgi:pyruvate formate lyase activating enzyme